ncbi:hypothetical protein AKO1_008167 [Acrasis kona]|uniref:DOPA 4,5-dioxygenase n=1 Tax=Acrasis kona TaxID=1008807 RepID=A0AAW2YNR6_9EUKA
MESTKFIEPILSYDIHVYYDETKPDQVQSAKQLYDRFVSTFMNQQEKKLPTTRIHKMVGKIGPHPIAMFEIDFKTPEEFSILVPWMQLNHGIHSVLIHPRLGKELLEHTQYALWLGDKLPLDTSRFTS